MLLTLKKLDNTENRAPLATGAARISRTLQLGQNLANDGSERAQRHSRVVGEMQVHAPSTAARQREQISRRLRLCKRA